MDAPNHSSVLGTCRACGTVIPTSELLATYDPPEDWPLIYARCPGCDSIGRPA